MKKIKLLALMAITSVAMFSCKKDKEENFGESPMQAIITAKLKTDTVTNQTNNAIGDEQGYLLKFAQPGKITRLGCRVPIKGNYSVSFWDGISKAVLASTIVSVTDTSVFQYVNITPLTVTANKNYVLSIHIPKSIKYFTADKTNANTSVYPITSAGGTTFVERRVKIDNGDNVVFPDAINASNQFYAGISDLSYIADK